MKGKIHYSWLICFGCALVLFCTGGLCFTGFAVYLPYMKSVLEYTNTQVSVILFVRSLLGVIGMMFVNRFLRRFEIRRVVTVALLMAAGSFLLYATGTTYTGYLAAAALSGAAYGFGSMIPVSILISRWFNDYRGMALGICMASTGVATFAASPLIAWAVENVSLRASYLGEACFISAVCILVWHLLRSMPSCLDLEPLGANHESAVAYAEETASRGMVHILTLGFLLLGTASNNIASNLSLLYHSVGYDGDRIASIVAFFGISLAIGKCVSGLVVDKTGPYRACGILFIVSIAGCTLCCTAGRTGLTTASTAVILIGFGMAVASIAPSAFALRVASERDYPGILSQFQTFHTLGGLLFTTVPGIVADRTGSYVISYMIMLGAIVVASILLHRIYHWVVCVLPAK